MSRVLRIACAVVVTAVMLGPQAGAEPGICTWGGTAAAPSGTFTIEPGLSNVRPASDPGHLVASGPVEGPTARCSGTLTFDATVLPGSTCRLFVVAGSMTGLDGVAWATEAGGAAGRGFLYRADGTLAGTFGASVLGTDAVDIVSGCLTPEGVTAGQFWATLELHA